MELTNNFKIPDTADDYSFKPFQTDFANSRIVQRPGNPLGLFINGLDVNSNVIRLRTAKTPSSASDTGNAGDICWDADYIYVCIATDTWKRVAISTW